MILILIVSSLGQILYSIISSSSYCNIDIMRKYLKVIIKLIITPITMILNFCVMKILSEKY